MRLEVVRDLNRLVQLAPAWRQLPCHSPMQQPTWLLKWWNIYGRLRKSRQLYALAIFVDKTLVALAPWYVETNSLTGPSIRCLGDGEVCSDHATILATPSERPVAVDTVAHWLHHSSGKDWTKLHWEAIDEDDAAIRRLQESLTEFGYECEQRPTPSTWSVTIPENWNDYLSCVSKSHRKRCRRWLREYFDSGRAHVEEARDPVAVQKAWHRLVKMNRLRRAAIGDKSAFDSSRFRLFHQSVIERLISKRNASIRTLYVDSEPVAVEYILYGNEIAFCYQSAMLTSDGRDGFGNLSLVALIQQSQTNGIRHVDFLRGDEPYKFHWNATPRPARDLIVRADTTQGRIDRCISQAIGHLRFVKNSFVSQTRP